MLKVKSFQERFAISLGASNRAFFFTESFTPKCFCMWSDTSHFTSKKPGKQIKAKKGVTFAKERYGTSWCSALTWLEQEILIISSNKCNLKKKEGRKASLILRMIKADSFDTNTVNLEIIADLDVLAYATRCKNAVKPFPVNLMLIEKGQFF